MRRVIWALPVPLTLLGLWSIAVRFEWLTLIPPPLEVLSQVVDFSVGGFRDDAYTASLASHLIASVGRVGAGFGLASITAIPLGIVLGRSQRLAALLEPTLGLLRPIPVTAWVPLILIVFGLGARSAAILIFIGSFYPVLLNTIAGVKRVPPRLVEAAAMLGTSPQAMLYKVVLPAAAPSIFAGVRIALGLAWVVVVVGETVGVPTGLGAVITEAREVSRTEVIITGMIFIGMAGLASDKLLAWSVERTLGTRFATTS
jgi:NitT/TauT family transport system permease protein